jgi:hypothetical protein
MEMRYIYINAMSKSKAMRKNGSRYILTAFFSPKVILPTPPTMVEIEEEEAMPSDDKVLLRVALTTFVDLDEVYLYKCNV